MKTKTYIQLSLLTPYIYWVLSAGIILLWYNYSNNELPENSIVSFLAYAVLFYALGIILWGIPYTVLAIGLWLWSRSKDIHKTIRVFALSPLFLTLLIAMEILILSYSWEDFPNGGIGLLANFGSSALGLGIFSVVYGYLIIGITAGVYNILKRFNRINDEEYSASSPSPSIA